jgi:hypothetical protein
MTAIQRVLDAADDLRRADAALSLEASRPPVKIVPADDEEGDDEEQ